MLRTIHGLVLSALLAASAGLSLPASAQTCTYAAVRKTVDDTGRVLRNIHQESQPRLDAGFRKLKEQRGWSEQDYLEKANLALTDERSEAFDAKAGELLTRLDQLAEAAEAAVDCAKIAEIEATALALQATVREKTRYMLARLDATIRDADTSTKSAAATTTTPDPSASVAKPSTVQPAQPAPPAPPPTAKARPPERPQAGTTPPPTATAPPPTRPQPGSSWSTSTPEVRNVPPAPVPVPSPPPSIATLPPAAPSTDGFSIDEIREVSRGFFGTLSSELGGVIEYAFSLSGRPTGYVLGTEGGGAFIAGVRYGRGTLYTRSGITREVYWHGPSIGYDFGASGSRTLFLVYRMTDPLELYTGFSGVDGSAYLVGGVGMTLLTDGKLVLAPIRTGLGLRLGASIGYVRFTSRPTWNPF